VCPCTSAVYVCTRPTYTAVFTAREHGAFTNVPCTRPYTRPLSVHGRVRNMSTAVYGPCTCVHGRIHGRLLAVSTAVYTFTLPCTWPCTGRAHVHTGRVHGKQPCTLPCPRPCTGRVHTDRVYGHVHVFTAVVTARTRPCGVHGLVYGSVYTYTFTVVYGPCNTAVFTAVGTPSPYTNTYTYTLDTDKLPFYITKNNKNKPKELNNRSIVTGNRNNT